MPFLDGDDYRELLAAVRPNIRESDPERPVCYATATEQILAGQVIWVTPTGAKRATGRVSGMALGDVNQNGMVIYKPLGLVYLRDWTAITGQANLAPGERYFLHAPGMLRTFPAASGYVAEVGEAQTYHLFLVRPGTFVKL